MACRRSSQDAYAANHADHGNMDVFGRHRNSIWRDVIACATDELCDEMQTQFSRFMNAHIIIIISHKPFNLIYFPFLTHNVNLFYIKQHFCVCCSGLRPVNHSPSDNEPHLSRPESSEINSLIPLDISIWLWKPLNGGKDRVIFQVIPW